MPVELAAADEESQASEDEDDGVPPELEGSMSVSPKRATAGDRVAVTLHASEDSGDVGAYGWFRNPETGQTMWFSNMFTAFDPATGAVVLDARVQDSDDPGRWLPLYVELSDAGGRNTSYWYDLRAEGWMAENEPRYFEQGTAVDMSALDFEVYGTRGSDGEAPTLLGVVSVSTKKASAGESVTMALKTEGHDVARASIVYRAPQSGEAVGVPLTTKSADGVMRGSMAITPETELGVWEAYSLELTDSAGTERSIENTALVPLTNEGGIALLAADDDILAGNAADLSGLSFEVVEPGAPTEPDEPANPSEPNQPSTPEQPTTPDDPAQPNEPATPTEPQQPATPDVPSNPTVPEQPANPGNASEPAAPSQPNAPQQPVQTGNTIAKTGDATAAPGLLAMAGGVVAVVAGIALVAQTRIGRGNRQR